MKSSTFTKPLQVFAALFVSALLLSCQELSIDSQAGGAPAIDVDAQEVYELYGSSPRTIYFNVSANTPWHIDSDKGWCRPSPGMSAAGSLTSEIEVTTDPNDTGEERTATLTITADGVADPITITVNQQCKSVLDIQPVDKIFGADGGDATFTIRSNFDWEVISSNQWLTFSQDSGEGSDQIVTITAHADPTSLLYRKATVTVRTPLDKVTFDVEQQLGDPINFVGLPEDAGTFPLIGQSKVFELTSPLAGWEGKSDQDWVQFEKVDDTHVKVSVFAVQYFSTATSRTAKAWLEVGGMQSETEIDITQPTNWITFAQNANSILNADKSVTLKACGANCRINTNTAFPVKLGVLKFTLSDINLPTGTWIKLFGDSGQNKATSSNFNLYFGTGYSGGSHTESKFFSGGTNFYTAGTSLNIANADLNSMSTIQVTIDYDDANNPIDKTKLMIQLEVNGVVKYTRRALTNPYHESQPNYENDKGTPIYCGFEAGSTAASGATFTIKKFEYYPLPL